MEPTAPPRRSLKRRNAILALAVLAAAVVLALIPTLTARSSQHESSYATRADVPRGAPVPGFVPPSATAIRVAREPGRRAVWMRFAFDPAETERMTAGFRRLTVDEVKRLNPSPPALSTWWQLNPNTLRGKRSGRVQVWQTTEDPPGHLLVDPSGREAFYWRP